MDEIVLRGMAKWPDVPAVYGWLALDRRGQWLIKGERISNPVVTAFIGRNYGHDAQGRWFFQNGPQRVFVSLDYTPLIYRMTNPDGTPLKLECHTGKPVESVSGTWIDESGVVLLLSEHGIGIVHDRDLGKFVPYFIDANGNPLAEGVLDGLIELEQKQQAAPMWLGYREANVKIEPIRSAEVSRRFGFIARPVQPAGQEECY